MVIIHIRFPHLLIIFVSFYKNKILLFLVYYNIKSPFFSRVPVFLLS
nr:MAG TPA_asm: hypothetical protein [Caudoviricetes sp.]